ncbi:hypothetical protein FB451DRAFT_1163699 [Mycena latifolia]|nr:hypothetical protein FB451DRAFT_1163699 [Mycena latifolia]
MAMAHGLRNAKLTSFSRSYIEDREVLTARSIWPEAISIESIRKLPVPQTGINVSHQVIYSDSSLDAPVTMASTSSTDVLVDVGLNNSSPGGPVRFIPFSARASNVLSPGGFNSGFLTGTADPTEAPELSFTVVNDRAPLFFFAQKNITSSCTGDQCNIYFTLVVAAQSPGGTNSPTAAGSLVKSPTSPIPSSITRDEKHTDVAAVVGSIAGSLVVLFLCVTAVLILRRRSMQRRIRYEAPRSLGPQTESGLAEIVPHKLVHTRPAPPVVSEKATLPESALPVPNAGPVTVLPTAAGLALASMADEMHVLRRQIQHLEQERRVLGSEPPDDLPPEYATR